MKYLQWIVCGVMIVLAFALSAFINDAFAQTEVPDGVQVFTIDIGQTCVLYDNGAGGVDLECYCPCETGSCPVTTYGVAPSRTVEPTDGPKATATPTVDTVSPTPTEIEPTATPEPTKTPKPAHERCNKGEGNGGENCDPGNYPEHGNDDEDDD